MISRGKTTLPKYFPYFLRQWNALFFPVPHGLIVQFFMMRPSTKQIK